MQKQPSTWSRWKKFSDPDDDNKYYMDDDFSTLSGLERAFGGLGYEPLFRERELSDGRIEQEFKFNPRRYHKSSGSMTRTITKLPDGFLEMVSTNQKSPEHGYKGTRLRRLFKRTAKETTQKVWRYDDRDRLCNFRISKGKPARREDGSVSYDTFFHREVSWSRNGRMIYRQTKKSHCLWKAGDGSLVRECVAIDAPMDPERL